MSPWRHKFFYVDNKHSIIVQHSRTAKTDATYHMCAVRWPRHYFILTASPSNICVLEKFYVKMMWKKQNKIMLRTNLILCFVIVCALLINSVQSILDVSCNHVILDKKINCQCYSSGSSSNVWESLSGIIQDYVDNSIARNNIDFSQVVLQECDNIMIEVDFG